jgi:hypothetical protein
MKGMEMCFSNHLIKVLYAAQLFIWRNEQNKIRELLWKREGGYEDV